MSKKLLASLIALSMVSAFACDDDNDKDEKCTTAAITCTDGQTAIKVCNKDGVWIDTTCEKMGVANGVCQNNACVASGNPSGSCTEGQQRCDNGKVQQCAGGQWSDKENCTASGKTCELNGTTASCKESGGAEETCSKDTYQGSCAADGLSGKYCNGSGKVVLVTCTADKPCVNNAGYIKCDDGSSGETLENCKMEKDADCTKCQVVCASDNSKGYYCNTNTGKIVEKTCKDNI